MLYILYIYILNIYILNILKQVTSVSNSILKGITRSTLIRGLKKRKIKYKESKFNLEDIKKASEAFITSATQHVMPVVMVDNIKIGKGVPGPRAQDFKAAYMESLKLTEL